MGAVWPLWESAEEPPSVPDEAVKSSVVFASEGGSPCSNGHHPDALRHVHTIGTTAEWQALDMTDRTAAS